MMICMMIGLMADTGHHLLPYLVAGAVLLAAAALLGLVFYGLGLPMVLAWLGTGIVLGNLELFGINALSFVKSDTTLFIIGEFGLALFMFAEGLEQNVSEFRRYWRPSVGLGLMGILLPSTLGMSFALGMGSLTGTDVPFESAFFQGATLAATSIGVSAMVLRQMGWQRSPTGRVILGAALVDDIVALILLSVGIEVIRSAGAGQPLALQAILQLTVFSVVFVLGIVLIGEWLMGRAYTLLVLSFKFARRRFNSGQCNLKDITTERRVALLLYGTAIALGMGALAEVVGLSPIVGAFGAGLVLTPHHLRELWLPKASVSESTGVGDHEAEHRLAHELEKTLLPVVKVLAIFFFVITGAQLQLAVFADPTTILMGLGFSALAVLGKFWAPFLSVFTPGVDRAALGWGMVGRGEVGIVFAGLGTTLMLAGQAVIGPQVYGALLLMIVVTTIVGPIMLMRRLAKLNTEPQLGSGTSTAPTVEEPALSVRE
jgi:Kef-type K+ transport system membrane component KefB